ncbi:hypothetical protein CFIMG_008047RA00001 [Ceratocystis fimbriata CBS 114723]|uniref:Uncharacterized protein n=1 Tax=Ceratocystis fimbriata CBS 114723 TaxID=1035309 RepID=A0A2C5X9V3_9PEZI|nr:hypothetical protein CFIMG_008047RA00001 [Ceratocystis fimbriata CBS 114723]
MTKARLAAYLEIHAPSKYLVDYLIKELPKTIELPTTAGNTPLLLACHFGRPEPPMLRALLDIFEQKLLHELLKQRSHVESSGFTPAHVAFQSLQQIRPPNPRNGTRRLF